MKRLFPHMYERPEDQQIMVSLFYSGFAFIGVPFILYLMVWGMNDDIAFLVKCELIFHVVNFLAAIGIFRPLLSYAWLTFRIDLKKCVGTALLGAFLICAVFGTLFYLSYWVSSDALFVGAIGSLPVSCKELYLLSTDQVLNAPPFGTLCMSLLAPVSVSLLLYATVFAPGCVHRPWLGYLLAALLPAIPRLVDLLTFWSGSEALTLYLAQLPAHMIACWTYQKTDTVWTPILTLSAANLIGCTVLIFLFS